MDDSRQPAHLPLVGAPEKSKPKKKAKEPISKQAFLRVNTFSQLEQHEYVLLHKLPKQEQEKLLIILEGLRQAFQVHTLGAMRHFLHGDDS